MRTTVNGHEIEGTASEIAELFSLLDRAPARRSGAPRPSSESTPFVSEQVAYDVLTRRELGETHVKLFQQLYDAGDEWTSAADLQRILRLTTREFAGVLGAFGRRLSNTDGTGSRSFLDQYWDQENGYNLYRLPPSVRAALERAKVVP